MFNTVNGLPPVTDSRLADHIRAAEARRQAYLAECAASGAIRWYEENVCALRRSEQP